jgi:hypothetical protein
MERTAAAPRTGPVAALTPARRGAANATRADAAVGAPGGGGAASTTGGTVAASSTRGDAAPTTRENGAALTTRSPATAGPAAASTARENAAATTRGNAAALRALSSATGTVPTPYTTPRSYTLALTLPPSTVSALAAGGFRLCLMHAVRCDTADGVPLVWATTTEYATATSLNWAAEPYGYAATSRTADGSPGGARDMRLVALGQVLDVGANALTSINPLPGDPRYVTARSTAPAPMVCGAAGTPRSARAPRRRTAASRCTAARSSSSSRCPRSRWPSPRCRSRPGRRYGTCRARRCLWMSAGAAGSSWVTTSTPAGRGRTRTSSPCR